MLVIKCKQCHHFSTIGLVNEYEETFCSKNCYFQYCNEHNYSATEVHPIVLDDENK